MTVRPGLSVQVPGDNSLKTGHVFCPVFICGSVAEWLACLTQAQKGPGSNRSRYAVG